MLVTLAIHGVRKHSRQHIIISPNLMLVTLAIHGVRKHSCQHSRQHKIISPHLMLVTQVIHGILNQIPLRDHCGEAKRCQTVRLW